MNYGSVPQERIHRGGPEAWFAALAIESGCEWITTDRDYEKFPGLHWRHPITGKASK